MKKLLYTFCACALFSSTGCIVLAPVSVSWRSNSSQQYATTDGKTTAPVSGNAVNADKTTETAAAVSTSSGTASTASQSAPAAESTPTAPAAE